MRKYNRDKRAAYNARIKNIDTRDIYDAGNKITRIHIYVKYDGYNKTKYIPIIYGKTRNNKAQKYVNTTNAINDIFPDINKPHNKHIYRATAPYKKFIPTQTEYTAPENMMDEYTYTEYKRERVKCIIYNHAGDKMIYYGIFTREIYIHDKKIEYRLHRADREIRVYPHIPFTDKINGVYIQELWDNNIEIYRI